MRAAPRPVAAGRPSSLCNEGQRRSASTSKTRALSWARTMARFAASLLFPSPAMELVTRTTCGGWPSCSVSSEVRKERRASRNGAFSYVRGCALMAALARWRWRCQRRRRLRALSLGVGMTPRRRPPSIVSSSCRERTLLSCSSRMRAEEQPKKSPAADGGRVVERHVGAVRAIGWGNARGIHNGQVGGPEPFENAGLPEAGEESLIDVAAAVGFLAGESVGDGFVVGLVWREIFAFRRTDARRLRPEGRFRSRCGCARRRGGLLPEWICRGRRAGHGVRRAVDRRLRTWCRLRRSAARTVASGCAGTG